MGTAIHDPLSPAGRTALKKALFILGQLTDLDVEWLIGNGRRENVAAGSVVIQQGAPVASLYLILAGSFSVVDEGLGQELARLGTGEVVGEMSFIDAAPPSATVRAQEDGTVLALPKPILERKLAEDDAFAARFYRSIAMFLSDRLRASVNRLGYGKAVSGIDESVMQVDEMDLNLLDSVHLAGARFDHILKRLMRE